ncbi:hypothetical protein BGZ99_008474 [Dissophora globulifera]|uniref:F-box domain-containing protein n=1 Tax=Dissophora globulifera TaxID=979702 RepID=A0A9P6UPC7_9FUNG|nr:hypothetical protein BGZ99_008474 [Dissophora globulifera]
MSTLFSTPNPLQIPEIRHRTSQFVSVPDAISCTRVSKAWHSDFISAVWNTLDFDIHTTFENLNSEIICKYGHHIHNILNLKTQPQLNAVSYLSVKNVRVLEVICGMPVQFRTLCLDLINNNSKHLEALSLEMDPEAQTAKLSNRMISVHAFVPRSSVSQLTSLKLSAVSFSRNSFANLLRSCPLLTRMDLQGNVVLLPGPFVDAFQHLGIHTLIAPIDQIFKPDPEFEILSLGSTLLVHFPNLIRWTCYSFEETLLIPWEQIKAEVTIYCPKLCEIDSWTSPPPALYNLVANVFHNLVSVAFEYQQLSTNSIMALLLHRLTLKEISAYSEGTEGFTEQDEIFSEADPFQELGRTLQLLPRICSNLTVLELESHEMDMDFIEEEEWSCKGLWRLRVRIVGLDSREKISMALNLWSEKRNMESGDDNEQKKGEQVKDIQTRVARHLLKFKELEWVWLGTRTFHFMLPSSAVFM